MKTLLTVSLALLPLLCVGCGGDEKKSSIDKLQEQKQDPIPVPEEGAGMLETLLKNREKNHAIFVADCPKKSESEALRSIANELEAKGVDFSQPKAPNYKYYLNRLIPIVRRRVATWVLYDHTNAKLTEELNQGLFLEQQILFRHQFDEGTLILVSTKMKVGGSAKYSLDRVTSTGDVKTNIVFTNDGSHMFTTGKGGQVEWFDRKGGKKGVALDLPQSRKKGTAGVFSGGEAGMIGLALHPDFDNNKKAYLHYNWREKDGSRRAVVSEWQVDMGSSKITFGNERVILEIEQTHDNHNAGCLKFGPDNFLYVAIGDGEQGKWTIGRSPAEGFRGKILRIDVDKQEGGKQYGIPADNPFVGHDKLPPETWAWGFRNPWRLAFIPDGRLLASDIGEDVNEELTFVVKGRHHGWPYYEGHNERNPWTLDVPLQWPLVPYGREHGMSVIAGGLYEGDGLPSLKGKFIFSDYLSGRIWAITLPDKAECDSKDAAIPMEEVEELGRWPVMMATMTIGPDGEFYVGAHTGEVLKLVPGGSETAPQVTQPADPATARSLFSGDFVGEAGPEVSAEVVDLGKALFADKRLSTGGKRGCASCHVLRKYGQDGRKAPPGSKRNTPSVFNVDRQFAQFRDYRSLTVEDAVLECQLTHLGHKDDKSVKRGLRKHEDLVKAFDTVFGKPNSATADNLKLAIGGYLRTLRTTSRWEQLLDGDDKALSKRELIGLQEFLSMGCNTCHMYRGLGGGMPQKLGLLKPWTGEDKGRGEIDKTLGQEFFFKVPSLFNVAKTKPYYHDGSMATLADAVRNMALIQLGRELSDSQTDAIVAFLKTLTGDLPK